MTPNNVLWAYIVLLIMGGIMGYLKAGSKQSLVASLGFAAALILTAVGIINLPYLADILLVVLLIFFGLRFAKTKKFMPGGLMAIVTVGALALRHIHG
jgi:uncharacterized membrane protein (UPF0136 family)